MYARRLQEERDPVRRAAQHDMLSQALVNGI